MSPTRYFIPGNTGAGNRDGQLLRYDVLAARYRGQALLVCASGTPIDAFVTHELLVQHLLHSLTP